MQSVHAFLDSNDFLPVPVAVVKFRVHILKRGVVE